MKKLLCLILALTLVACSDGTRMLSRANEPIGMVGNAAPVAEVAPGTAEARRYIAFIHEIKLEAPAASLPQQFLAIQEECLKLGCEILDAAQVSETPHQPPHASLTARVPPASFERFLASTQAKAKLLAHHRKSEDKTAEVIDVEARIKNLEALKTRVLDLLAKRTGDMKEILAAEKQLAETQSELDSINGKRRALAKQTDMVRVEIELVSQSLRAEGSFAAPVADALKESGKVLMSSLGMLITLAVAAFPWVLSIWVLVIGVRRLIRRRKLKAAAKEM